MKFSIITPSYNQGRFIDKCLASVQNQQGDFIVEHIIMDNCSTDSTFASLSSYQSNPANVDVRIFTEKDSGQTAAINKGFGIATGDIISWLNTDEWYDSDALARISQYFSAHPDIDVVFGDCDFVDSIGKLVKRKREIFYSESMLLYYGCYIPSCSTFVRRKVIDDGVILRPEYKVTMDFDWYVRMAKAGYRFGHLPATLATFTWHEGNISSNMVKRRLIERRMVQDQYSQVAGPAWFRSGVYGVLRNYWLAVRVIRRWVA
ncbi:MAG TPA: glycosyltransferase family 2 protein [Bacillota bacterium]|jgi:glycosyltransferase involved in cell wall biosynthesis|nr:glycosyltransferase family 2 protein [Bacillota bacterium]